MGTRASVKPEDCDAILVTGEYTPPVEDLLSMLSPDFPIQSVCDILSAKIGQLSASLARLRGTVDASLDCDAANYREHLMKTLRGWVPHLLTITPDIVGTLMIFTKRLEESADAGPTTSGGGNDGYALGERISQVG